MKTYEANSVYYLNSNLFSAQKVLIKYLTAKAEKKKLINFYCAEKKICLLTIK